MGRTTQFHKLSCASLKGPLKCVDVYDGDTITVEMNVLDLYIKYGDEEYHDAVKKIKPAPVYIKCRMMGYNSAEVSHCTEEEKHKGKEAKEFLTDLILDKFIYVHFLDKGEGKMAIKKNDDPYGRELVDVWLLDVETLEKHTYVNELMVEKGHGKHYEGHGPKLY